MNVNLHSASNHLIVPQATSRAWTRHFMEILSLVAFCILCLSNHRAYAQLTTADILGTVTDPSGAAVPNARVTARNLGNNIVRTAVSNSGGSYFINLLEVGHYSIKFDAPGFKSTAIGDLSLEAGDRARADGRLTLGSTSETVDVEAQTPLLQADNATVSSTIGAQAVQDLPLNGRNFVQLVQLIPGANEGPGNGLTSGQRPDDRRQTSGFSVNGQDSNLNNFTIDGVDDNERIIGTIGVKPDIESINEISVQTNSYAPEAGRTAGGVVNIVTRAGTNQVHGSIYEFFRNNIFDANQALTPHGGAKAELRQNQYGASLGGPIRRDKDFFFGDYEGLRLVAGVPYSSTVPTLAQYNDINSLNGGTPQALLNSGNGTAGQPIDPIALNYLKLFPAPNAPGISNNYIVNPNETQTSNTYDVRLDHKFNDSNQFFTRFTYNGVTTFTPQSLGTQNGLQISGGRFIFAGPATDTAQQYTFNYTHIFSPNLVMDLRAAFTRINNLSLPLNYGLNADTTVGFGPNMNYSPLSNFLTPISFGNFNDIGDGAFVPLQDIDNTFQYLGTLTYTHGKHNIVAGASFIRRQARNVQSPYAAGQYGFGLNTDSCTGPYVNGVCPTSSIATPAQIQQNNLASSLTGAFTFANRSNDITPPDYRTTEPSVFIQDTWKVGSKLTLVYGGRYDIFTPFTEAHNRISNFDFFQALSSGTVSGAQAALQVANTNGVGSTAGIKTDYSNFAPRLGFAYSVNPKLVVRGGYGLSYFPGNYTANADLKNAPFTSVYAPNCIASEAFKIEVALGQPASQIQPDCATVPGAVATFDAGLPLPAPQNINSNSLSFTSESPSMRSALMQQFNLQVEQQFGSNVLTIGYVGNIGQHLPQEFNDINVPQPAATLNPATNVRPLSSVLPNLSSVSYVQSEGISNYNGLQTTFQRRFTHGLSFDLNYTWAKGMNDYTGFSEEGQQGYAAANPFQIRQIEYGIAELNIAHRFAAQVDYALQYGRNFTGAKRFIWSGWQINGIGVYQSGKPFTVVNSPSAGGFSNRASTLFNGGNDRPNQIHTASLAHKTNAEFFDVTAFVPQPLGTVGNTKRNSLFGPHFRHADVSLFKDFNATKGIMVQFRAESFNITNTPNYYIDNNEGNGATNLGSASFGQVTGVDPNYTPRELQFALKVTF